MSAGTCLFLYGPLSTKGQWYCHVKCALCLRRRVICYLISIDHHSVGCRAETDGWDLQLLLARPSLLSRELASYQLHIQPKDSENEINVKGSKYLLCIFDGLLLKERYTWGRSGSSSSSQHFSAKCRV